MPQHVFQFKVSKTRPGCQHQSNVFNLEDINKKFSHFFQCFLWPLNLPFWRCLKELRLSTTLFYFSVKGNNRIYDFAISEELTEIVCILCFLSDMKTLVAPPSLTLLESYVLRFSKMLTDLTIRWSNILRKKGTSSTPSRFLFLFFLVVKYIIERIMIATPSGE